VSGWFWWVLVEWYVGLRERLAREVDMGFEERIRNYQAMGTWNPQ
jgi:hypothetical protein